MSRLANSDTMPTLHVSIWDGREFAAAHVSPGIAILSRRAYSDRIVIHIEADLRASWLRAARSEAMHDEYPIHPTPLEARLFHVASLHELQWMTLEDDSLIFWDRTKYVLDVCPILLRARVLEVLDLTAKRRAA